MNLPQDLQPHFVEPALIVVADHIAAKFYLAGGDAIEEVDSLSLPHERMTDNETTFTNTATGGSSGPEPKTEEERQHQFIHMMQERLEDFIREGIADHIFLAMDAELAHMIKHHLPGDMAGMIKKEVHHSVMKENILDVVKRFFA